MTAQVAKRDSRKKSLPLAGLLEAFPRSPDCAPSWRSLTVELRAALVDLDKGKTIDLPALPTKMRSVN